MYKLYAHGVFGDCSYRNGFIWSDVLGILLNVNRWVKEIRNISRRCKTTDIPSHQ